MMRQILYVINVVGLLVRNDDGFGMIIGAPQLGGL
jgi:hypothetical protein